MKTDKELEQLIQPIVELYNKIELDLLIEIAKRFEKYSQVGIIGSLEWYTSKLDELGGLNTDAVNLISQYTRMTKKQIYKMLEEASYANIDKRLINTAYDVGLANVNYDTLIKSETLSQVINNSYKELNETFRMINTKAIEATKQAYMDVLGQSYLEVSSGIYDYNTSIRKAIQEMVDEGITCATYKRKNGKIANYSIEGIVRRDVRTAVFQASNKAIDDLSEVIGSDYVEVSSHYNARISQESEIANHAGWQGKIYKLHGFDEKYGNFFTHCGEGEIEGFGGVNCMHRKWSFIPGVSKPTSIQYDYDEVKKAYELSKKQRYLERQVRKEKQHIEIAKTLGDTEYLKKHQDRLKQKQHNLKSFCEENNLGRDYNREFVAKNNNKIYNKLGNSNKSEPLSLNKSFIEKIDVKDIDEKLSYYENGIRSENKEYSFVITNSGDVWSFSGDQNNVLIDEVDLSKAIVTHNHLFDESDQMYHSFGEDDFMFLKSHQDIKQLRTVNEQYDYNVSVLKEIDIDKTTVRNKGLQLMFDEDKYDDDWQHYMFKYLRNEGYVKYERINRRTKEKD